MIYKITNNLNGKFYIGKHITEDLDDGYMGSGVVIQKAIKKYGVENFTKEILFDVYGEDMMNFLEEAIVDEAFVAREDTYNIALGGKGGFAPEMSEETKRKIGESHKGNRQSEETRKKIGEACKGRHHSEETKRKMSESRKGHPGYMKGKHSSEETKRKMSEAHKGKHHSEEARRKMSESHKQRLKGRM